MRTRDPHIEGPTALSSGLIGCEICGRAVSVGAETCTRCGGRLPRSGRRSTDAVWAWLFAGMIFYIPANLYPMLIASQFGSEQASTIVGGAIDLIDHGSYAIAVIVLVASVVIPITKFAAIIWLCLLVRGRGEASSHRALQLYEVVEFIGRWSMIDVFVVAILAALVQMGFLASLQPGAAAPFFALSVAFTMMAARAFDPRLIWDRLGGH
ncbi:MAG: paraquat-inducible protein A [Pseudomonadota bacterium]